MDISPKFVFVNTLKRIRRLCQKRALFHLVKDTTSISTRNAVFNPVTTIVLLSGLFANNEVETDESDWHIRLNGKHNFPPHLFHG